MVVGGGFLLQQISSALVMPKISSVGRKSVTPIAVTVPMMTRVGSRLIKSPIPKATAIVFVGSRLAKSLASSSI